MTEQRPLERLRGWPAALWEEGRKGTVRDVGVGGLRVRGMGEVGTMGVRPATGKLAVINKGGGRKGASMLSSVT